MNDNIFETGVGFSIELIGWCLEYRGEHENLPLYECLDGEITAIAIVENPAVGIKAIGNEKERIITGVVMIPNLRIFRNIGLNARKESCYWYFSEETIAKYQKNFKGQIKIGH
jgi:hypothetical protein